MTAVGGIQTSVGGKMAPGIEGAWASTNPRSSYVAGPGGLVAGSAGLTVGRFAWVDWAQMDADNAPAVANNFGSGNPSGFFAFEMQALITGFLGSASMLAVAGQGVTLMTDGDYWVKNYGSNYATPGMYCYADLATGKPSFASGVNAANVISPSSAYVTAQTGKTVTGYIIDNILYVTTATNPIYRGSTLTAGTGVTVGAKVKDQLTSTETGGALNGKGTYSLDTGEMTAYSAGSPGTITFSYGQLTITTLASGTVVLGAMLGTSASDTVPANDAVTDFITGTGGTGNYAVSSATAIATSGAPSSTLTLTTNVVTVWTAQSGGAAGELIKIATPRQRLM